MPGRTVSGVYCILAALMSMIGFVHSFELVTRLAKQHVVRPLTSFSSYSQAEDDYEAPLDRRIAVGDIVKSGQGTILSENPIVDDDCYLGKDSITKECVDFDPLFSSRPQYIRPLGGYERLLSRQAPILNGDENTNSKERRKAYLALSHTAVFILRSSVSESTLIQAVARCMERHPILRAYISIGPGNKKYWTNCRASNAVLASTVVTSSEASSEADLEQQWKEEVERSLNFALFPAEGPLWGLKNIAVKKPNTRKGAKSAWVFSMNHAIDDQQSVNIIVHELLDTCNSLAGAATSKRPSPGTAKDTRGRQSTQGTLSGFLFPESVEKAVAPGLPNVRTFLWAIYQVLNLLSSPVMIPKRVLYNFDDTCTDPDKRRTFCRYFILTNEETNRLRLLTKSADRVDEKFTITHILSAAMLFVVNSIIQRPVDHQGTPVKYEDVNLRFLLSVGLRAFGSASYTSKKGTAGDYTGGTVACAAGAVDFIVPIKASAQSSAETVFSEQTEEEKMLRVLTAQPALDSQSNFEKETEAFNVAFWDVARHCKTWSRCLVSEWKFVPESVRLFGFGMDSVVDILKAVEIDANSRDSLGRGFSTGVSNMGVVKFGPTDTSIEKVENRRKIADTDKDKITSKKSKTGGDWFQGLQDIFPGGKGDRERIKSRSVTPHSNGETTEDLRVENAYYGVSHGRNGVLCLLSCMTINGCLSGCLQFTSPLVTAEDADYAVKSLKKVLTETIQ